MVVNLASNALIPIVTSLGPIVNGLIHGSMFLGRVFSLPGFGSIVVNGEAGLTVAASTPHPAPAIFKPLAVRSL